MYQPHSLGLSKNLRDQVGHGLAGEGMGCTCGQVQAYVAWLQRGMRGHCGKRGLVGSTPHDDTALLANHMRPLATLPPLQGYALMCVSMPLTDCVLETVPEDDAYMLQVRV